MRDKKGLQHVEFIISFVFFIGFLTIALYFFNPIKTDRIVDPVLFYTIEEISGNIITDLESFSISLDKNLDGSNIAIPFSEYAGLNVKVIDSSGNLLQSGFIGGIVYIVKGENDFITILFSEDFVSGSLSDGVLLDDSNYSISSYDKREVLSESKIQRLKEDYEDDYENLKEEIKLPDQANFGFSLEFSEDDKITAQRDIPVGLEVFGESKRHEILRINNNLEFADLRVVIW